MLVGFGFSPPGGPRTGNLLFIIRAPEASKFLKASEVVVNFFDRGMFRWNGVSSMAISIVL